MACFTSFTCPKCNKSFTQKNSLVRHNQTHNEGTVKVRNSIFICAECNRTFTRKDNLIRHIRKDRGNTKKVGNGLFTCAECNKWCPRKDILVRHIRKKHIEKSSSISTMSFDTDVEFLVWKDNEEQRSCSKFVQRKGSWKTKNSKKTKYLCHRSGYVRIKEPASRKYALRKKGSCKINNHCTAYILYEEFSDGRIVVEYNPIHCNHDFELKHLPISFGDKVRIVDKLKEGVSLDQILDDIRNTLDDSSFLTRTHLITKKDLNNIKAEFHISCKARLSDSDTVSVELLFDQYRNSHGEETPFRYYKRQGVEDEEFEKDDVLLVIMTPIQIKFMKAFGSNIICIDSTHATTGYDFLLNTVFVLDDFNMGIPVAHAISNKENEHFLRTFFKVIKKDCGVIVPNVFMSDDFPVYLNAWNQVMEEPKKILLCTWHIDRNWRENLNRIKQAENEFPTTAVLKKEVYKAARTLMDEADENVLLKLIGEFIENLEQDPATKNFGEYFKKKYAPRYQTWAVAFRKDFGLNTNMEMEALHRVIKSVYFKGKKNNRMDVLVNMLLRMNRDKAFQRVNRLVMKTDIHQLQKIRDRHKQGIRIPKENVSILNDSTATVISQTNRSSMYTVSKINNACDCRLCCEECNICVHLYRCTCRDNTVHLNLCKHIHAFVKFQNTEEWRDAGCDEKVNEILNLMQLQDLKYKRNEENSFESLVYQLLHNKDKIKNDDKDETYIKIIALLKQSLKLIEMKSKYKQ